MTWAIVIPAWGDRCVADLEDISLPAIRAAVDYASIERPSLIVHTDQPDVVRRVAGDFALDCRPVPMGRSKYDQLRDCHMQAINDVSDGTMVMLNCSDMIVSREVFAASERRFAEGKRIVMGCSPSTLAPDAPAGLSASELIDWSVRYMHPYTRERFWGGSASPPSVLLFRGGENITLRAFHLHPIAMVKDRPIKFFGTIDQDLPSCFRREEIHIVTTRDDIAMAECSPHDRQYQRSRRPVDVAQIAQWCRKIAPVNWWLSTHRIVLTGDAVPPDDAVWHQVLRHAPPAAKAWWTQPITRKEVMRNQSANPLAGPANNTQPPSASMLTGADVAIIVGGAIDVAKEVEEAKAMCAATGVTAEFFVINDMIPQFPEPCVAVSLHPDKLPAWLAKRDAAGYTKPAQVWAHNRRSNHQFVTDTLRDRGGSSGLFAAFVAMERGYERIILCGVPMSVERNHFIRKVKWVACSAFWRAWITHKKDIAPYVRSLSGQTAEMLGKPTPEFLKGEKEAIAA